MMEKRTSFIFYSDWWEHLEMLSDGEALSVIKAIFCYQRSETVPGLAGAAAMAFSFIRAQLDRDAEKWGRVRRLRAEAGRTGGLRTQQNNRELKQVQANAVLLEQNEANQAVPVTAPVTAPVTEIGSKAGKPSQRKRFAPPSIDEVQKYCQERGNTVDAEQFCAFYESKGWRVGNQPMKSWQAAVLTWERRERKDRAEQKAEGTSAYEHEL